MTAVQKNIKQYSFEVERIDEFAIIGERYTAVKNYATSRYSGINSIHLLNNYRTSIRDVWVKSTLVDQFKLPARYWKLALDEAIANIKSMWSNVKNRIKETLNKNENLTDDEKYYIRYVLKSDLIFQSILQRKDFNKTKKLGSLEIREKYIHSLICRYTRRYKGKIPYSNKARSFMVDAPMYEYTLTENKLTLAVAGLEKGKRIPIKLKDKNIHTGNLRIVIQENNTVEVHRTKKMKLSEPSKTDYIIGIDKGYTSLFAVSSNKEYGVKLGEILTKETERLNKVNSKRNQIYAQMEKCKKEGDLAKAERIRINNFGKKKYNKQKFKNSELVKSYINHGIYEMLNAEKPTTIVCEKLDFTSWYKKMSKSQKRKLSRWVKGYIQERLEYICSLRQIKVEEINPAYTSQICSKCGDFGVRKEKSFTCECCGDIDADINASHNIKNRFDDKEITLYTSYKKVKEILINRKIRIA